MVTGILVCAVRHKDDSWSIRTSGIRRRFAIFSLSYSNTLYYLTRRPVVRGYSIKFGPLDNLI
jgi:hypothetical protein